MKWGAEMFNADKQMEQQINMKNLTAAFACV
jgi:hypothetical protein